MTDIVDGKAIARSIQEEVTEGVRQLEAASAILPGLAVVLVGDDSASMVYINRNLIQTRKVGIRSFEHRLPVPTSDDELLALIQTLNSDSEVLVAAFLPRWRALPVTPCPSPRS